jgi:hypothetical protein
VIDTGVCAKTTKKGNQAKDFNKTKFTKGYDFVNDDDDPYDDHAHGTHVAGTIAESTNNNEGVAGLAFESSIMPLKVLSASGSGTTGDIADAIAFAADKGAHVINMSLGGPTYSKVMHDACKYALKKGVTIVCAAGNGFGEGVGFPAAYPECIAVSSVGPTKQLAKYSSYGKQVALAAPGGDMIDSRDPKDGILQNTIYPESAGGRGDDYYAFQGTSMASPHVAAVAALIVAGGEKDPARVRDVLVKTAEPGGRTDQVRRGHRARRPRLRQDGDACDRPRDGPLGRVRPARAGRSAAAAPIAAGPACRSRRRARRRLRRSGVADGLCGRELGVEPAGDLGACPVPALVGIGRAMGQPAGRPVLPWRRGLHGRQLRHGPAAVHPNGVRRAGRCRSWPLTSLPRW